MMMISYGELQQWAKDGLIPPFEKTTFVDVVLTDVFRTIREHILECECKHAEKQA